MNSIYKIKMDFKIADPKKIENIAHRDLHKGVIIEHSLKWGYFNSSNNYTNYKDEYEVYKTMKNTFERININFDINTKERILKNIDRRKNLDENNKNNNPIIKLFIKINDEDFLGTGFFISNKHILTAAHCVTNGNLREESTSIVAVDYKNKKIYYSNKIFIHQRFSLNINFDISIIEIKEEYNGALWELDSTSFDKHENDTIYVSGYPGEYFDNEIYYHNGKDIKIKDYQIEYNIDTTPGQSGSPIYYYDARNNPNIIGIHTRSNNKLNQGIVLPVEIIEWFWNSNKKGPDLSQFNKIKENFDYLIN